MKKVVVGLIIVIIDEPTPTGDSVGDVLVRALEPTLDASKPLPNPPTSGIAPRLRELMEQYAASGLPPAYIPSNSTRHDSLHDSIVTTHDLDLTDPEESQ